MSDTIKNQITGYLAAILSTAIWSGNFIIARGLRGQIPPVALATLRWSVAVAVFLPFAWKQLSEDFSAIRKNWIYMLFTSVLGVSAFNTLVYIAGQSTGALNISMISIMFPVFIILISRIVLKDRFPFRVALGVLLVFFGAVLLITKGRMDALLEVTPAIGDLWMLLAALVWAVYSLLLRRRPEGIRTVSFQMSSFIIGLCVLLPFFLADRIGRPAIPFQWQIAGSVAYIGVLASLVAFVSWNRAVSHLGPVKAGMVYYTSPIFSAILSVLILSEPIRPFHFISMAVIAAGIVVVNWPKAANSVPEP